MFKGMKKQTSRVLAWILALVMFVSLLPASAGITAFAALVNTFEVRLPAGVDGTVSFVDEADPQAQPIAVATVNGVADFAGLLDDEKTYTVKVTGMENYKDLVLIGESVSGAYKELAVGLFTAKAEQTIAFGESTVVKKYTDAVFPVVLTDMGAGTGEVTYDSSKETVAMVNKNGTVNIQGVGSTVITATKKADANYKSAQATVTVTVEQAENGIAYTDLAVSWEYGDKKTNALTVKDGAEGTVTYESSNTAVATVDQDGQVTVLKPDADPVTITATFTAKPTSGYANSVASYTVTATKKTDALAFGTTEINVTYGDASAQNDTLKPTNITGKLTYSSSNPGVATVDEDSGVYTIVGAGSTTITVSLGEDDNNYKAHSASYTLRVAPKTDALSFENKSQVYTYGDPVQPNELTVAHAELGGFSGNVNYESSDDTIVAVDAATGALMIKKAGEVTITASIDAEANYAQASASYKVTVNKAPVSIRLQPVIDFGQKDAVADAQVAAQIAEQVPGQLVNTEKDDTAIVNAVIACIRHNYGDALDSGTNRCPNTYTMGFDEDALDNHPCYSIAASGTLTVNEGFTVTGQEYAFDGLNDGWGSAKNKVVIKVTDENKYSISQTDTESGLWTEKSLTFDAPEAGGTTHDFYIRNLEDDRISQKVSVFFGIDGEKPEISLVTFKDKYNDPLSKVLHFLSFGFFCNEQVAITVEATDAAPSSGIASIELFLRPEGGADDGSEDIAVPSTDGVASGKFAVMPGVKGTFYVQITDKVGNTHGKQLVSKANSNMAAENGYVMLETNAPDLSDITDKTVDGHDAPVPHKYAGDIAVTFTAEDTDAGLYEVQLALFAENIDVYVADYLAANTEATVTEALLSIEKTQLTPVTAAVDKAIKDDSKDNELHTFTMTTTGIVALMDGSYNFVALATDNAGNVTGKYLRVEKDLTSPVIADFSFDASVSKEACEVLEDYGFYFKEAATVEVTAADNKKDHEMAAGVQSITVILHDKVKEQYYAVDKDGNMVAIDDVTEEAIAVQTADSLAVKIEKDFKGQIYAFATDAVGNTPTNSTFDFDNVDDVVDAGALKGYRFPNGSILESATTHEETSSIIIEAPETAIAQDTAFTYEYGIEGVLPDAGAAREDEDKVPLYAQEPTFVVTVKDTYSGIKAVKVTLVKEGDLEDEILSEIVIDNKLPRDAETVEDWTINGRDENLVTSIQKSFPVEANFNNLVLLVELTDRAGNCSYDYYTFGVDKTAPVITVEMNDDDAEKYDGFFKADRKAIITVKERNFRNDLMVFTATLTDDAGVKKDVTIPARFVVETEEGSEAPKSYGKADGHEYYVYTMEYVFAEEGDYIFAIAGKDVAEYEGSVSYVNAAGQDIRAISTAFTVDKTLPVITVSYDNNTAKNDKYFDKGRVATVVIIEHNFRVENVRFTRTAALDGAEIELPAVNWVHEGNVHTATIPYEADGDYTFDVTMTDQAANAAAPANYGDGVAPKDFVVDKTIAKPVITGVANGNAYKNTVIPAISFTDVNFAKHTAVLTRTRKDDINNNVTDTFIKSIVVDEKGGSGTFDTFEKLVENDGIYTLTVTMEDKAGNEATEAVTFSVNRFGSVYTYTDYMASLINGGGQYITGDPGKAIAHDLVITEYNADKLLEGSLKVLITRDGETVDVQVDKTPVAAADMKIGNSGWYEYTYVIKTDNFVQDGVYKITLSSEYATVDADKNESTSVPANSKYASGEDVVDSIGFTVDTTRPEIRNIVNLEKAIINAQDVDVKFTVIDVGGLKSIEIILNGKTIETITEFGDNVFSYSGQFNIAEGKNTQTVQLKVTDRAGNVTDTKSDSFSTGDLYVFNDSVTVSTNPFVRWYANKPLFWGSIGGFVALVAVALALVAFKRKKAAA